MTLATTANRMDYTGDGTTTAYPYTFKILAQTDLEVYVDSVLQTITTDYTVSGVGNAAGGTVTFTSAPDDDSAVAIVRNAAGTQSVDFVDNDSFTADTLEGALDRLTMLYQQAKEIATRTVRFAAGSVHAASGVIFPDFVASKYVRVNSDCTGFELVELEEAGTYADPVTTPGDLIIGSLAGVQSRLAVGNCDGWLSVASTGLPAWRARTYDPMIQAKGDLVAGTAENTRARIAKGTDGYVLTADSNETPGLGWLPPFLWGTSRLTYTSTSAIALGVGLIPLKIDGVWQIKPVTAAVSGSNSGLTACTVYNVYALDCAGTTTLEFSVAAHDTDTTFGVEIRSGDATRTLVGKVGITADGHFADCAKHRLVISYFSRREIGGVNGFTADRSTTSATYTEVNTEIRIHFLTWSDEAVVVATSGSVLNNTAGDTVATAVGIDGLEQDAMSLHGQATNARGNPGALLVKTIGEGFHYATLMGAVSNNTGTWEGGASGDETGRTTLTTKTRG